MTERTVEFDMVEQNVAVLTLNRPKVRNALSPQLAGELTSALQQIAADDKIGAVVITGKGNTFSAGADFKSLSGNLSAPETKALLTSMFPLLRTIVNSEKPVIAAVNGFAMGGGYSLALACDLIVAADKAVFSHAFVNVGLIPDGGSIYFLARLVGLQRAKELIFTGVDLTAEQAKEIGMVNRVVPLEKMLEESVSLAHKIASGPRIAHAYSKKMLHHALDVTFEQFIELESFAQTMCFHTEDHKGAVQAMFNRERPVFKGK